MRWLHNLLIILFGSEADNPLRKKNCYCCSYPFEMVARKRHIVTTTMRGYGVRVAMCTMCTDHLNKHKKVRVLYLPKDNEPAKHWSDVEEYRPNPKDWSLNQPEKTTLKIVK